MMKAPRTPHHQRVVTPAPSPWRRRKRLRVWRFLGSATDVMMVIVFSVLLAFACYAVHEHQVAHRPDVSHARVRPGASVAPLPETQEAPK
jgi:hypothetical protein